MPVCQSPLTTQQIADATGCCIQRTTAKAAAFEDRMARVMEALVPGGRPDRKAAAAVALATTIAALQAIDPDDFLIWMRSLAEESPPNGSRH